MSNLGEPPVSAILRALLRDLEAMDPLLVGLPLGPERTSALEIVERMQRGLRELETLGAVDRQSATFVSDQVTAVGSADETSLEIP